ALVCHVISAASEGGCHVINAVFADEAVRMAIGSSATCIHNPDAPSGQASSIRVGLQSMPEEVAGALIMLGDQPLVGSRTVGMLRGGVWRRWRRCAAARPVCAGGGCAVAGGDRR